MKNRSHSHRNTIIHYTWFLSVILGFLPVCLQSAGAGTINIASDIHFYTSLTGDIVNMTGISELHLTDGSAPLSGCTINLNSTDAFLFLENIKPSVAAASYLSQVKVNNTNAALNTNVRVVEYASGAVIIPQSSTFKPLQVFTSDNFQGSSASLSQYTAYTTSSLGAMANTISSFILKRGYTATFAQNSNGTGYSKNYVAQDCDLEIAVLPAKLNNQINFIRIFPWRWVSKKGIGGNIGANLDIKWWYNWNLDQNSTLDKEYVPIRQNRWWPGLGQDWKARGASHLLGYNEPDHTDQANIAVGDAIWSWPDLLATGLRVGSPATTDGGRDSWLYPFIDQADAADLRVDFVAVHYYWCYNPSNPTGAANQMYNFLKAVHDRTNRPIWITEWNNGANWTGCGDPTYDQQAAAIGAMLDMLDSTPWVERYAIYNWVEDVRRVQWDDGWPTTAGFVYRDQVSPIGYRQETPGSGKSAAAIYTFNNNFRDVSGNGNNPLIYGAPQRPAGRNANALNLDGVDDRLILPANMGQAADFTFAAWVYWRGGDSWQRIFDFGNNTTEYMFLTPTSGSNTLRFAITTSGGGGNEQKIETAQLTANQWVHVAVTLNGNTGALYVNGTPRATSSSITLNPSDFNPAINYIGDSQWSADPLFNGMIDDIIIADYALTSAQINELINSDQPARFINAPLNLAAVSAGSAQSGNPAFNACDRNLNTRWANDGAIANSWIKYDLGSSQKISRVQLALYNGASRTYPLRIEIDGVPVFSGNSYTSTGFWETSFAPTTGRYVTITMTGNNSSGSAWFSILDSRIWPPQNQPPAFDTSPVVKTAAIENTAYSDTLAGNAADPDSDAVTFTKITGPNWLSIATNGTLSGIPLDADTGPNTFTVRVSDSTGLYDTNLMTIQVANIYSGARGVEDLLGLAAHWLEQGCLDTPACSGADLNNDQAVTLTDFDLLTHNWLQ